MLYLFTPRVRLGRVSRHICWHTSFVYISEAKVRFIYTTWPPEARSAAIFVDILRHEVIDPAAIFVYITWLWPHFRSQTRLLSTYVDDILIYVASCINSDTITQHSNSIHHHLQLNPTMETKDQVNFLDLSIIRKAHQFEIDIFRKPTTIDNTITYLSNHQYEHKLAEYKYYIDRNFNHPLNNDRLHTEWHILHIAKSNKFPTTLLHKLKHQVQHRIMHATPHKRWKQHKVGNLHLYLPKHTQNHQPV